MEDSCEEGGRRKAGGERSGGREEQVLCTGERDEGVAGKRKKATVERLFRSEMKGADGERAISKGNIITFSYLLLERSGGGKRKGEEGGRRRHRGAFKSNNPSLRYTRSSSSSLFTFQPNLSILLYISPPFSPASRYFLQVSQPPTHSPAPLTHCY